MTKIDFQEQRERMVRDQIAGQGIRSPVVIEAMSRVPREKFVALSCVANAYEDRPLPIGDGQTISQPYIVAFMVEALNLQPGDKVLEIGAGSGYAAAVLAEIVGQVFAIERIGRLALRARQNLKDAGYGNASIRHGDGTRGWVEDSPFDAILVSAGATIVPKALVGQLKVGGRMVIPVGPVSCAQTLLRITRAQEDVYETETLADVRFVPLIGDGIWEVDK